MKIISDNKEIFNYYEIPEIFNYCFNKIAEDFEFNLSTGNVFNPAYIKSNNRTFPPSPVLPSESSLFIKNFKLTKLEIDYIPVKILCEMREKFAPVLFVLINECFS